MKEVKIEELRKGDLVLIKWFDASELRAKLNQHEKPEVAVYEHIKGWDEWGVARIPVTLIEEIILLMPRSYQKTFPNLVLKKIKIRKTRRGVKVKI